MSVRAAGWRWAVWRCRAIPEAVAPAPMSVLLWGLRGSWSVTLAVASAGREGQGWGPRTGRDSFLGWRQRLRPPWPRGVICTIWVGGGKDVPSQRVEAAGCSRGLGEVKPGLPSLSHCPSPALQPKEAVPTLPALGFDLLFCEMGLTGLMPEPASESPGKVLNMHSPRLHL